MRDRFESIGRTDRASPRSRLRLAALGIGVLALTGLAAIAADGPPPNAGLTGMTHPDDVVQARQTMMDGIETEMMTVDQTVLEGKTFPLESLKAHAATVNSYLTAFPHLFPPQTFPGTAAKDSDAPPTNALPTVWQDFEGFYAQVQKAANAANDASQAKDIADFRVKAKALRDNCDACHAKYMHLDDPAKPPGQ